MPKLEPMTASSSRGGRRGRTGRVSTSLAEINVVPLVDVMLVLLVIFMVAAPMMQQGETVQLPQSRRSRSVTAPVTVTIPLTFRSDHRVQLDGAFVGLDVLDERVKQALEAHEQKTVILAGDTGITLGETISVFDRLNEGGVTSVSLQTEPPTGR